MKLGCGYPMGPLELLDFVLRVAAREAEASAGRTELTHAVIRNLYT